jgi:2'-phosphotransferase
MNIVHQQRKQITRYLRHVAKSSDVEVDPEGFIKAVDIRNSMPGTWIVSTTDDDLVNICQRDDRHRLSYRTVDGVLFLKANYGHSTDVARYTEELDLETLEREYPVLHHGTYSGYLREIRRRGLRCGVKRRAITLYTTKETIPRGRGRDVFFELNTVAAAKAGAKFYRVAPYIVVTCGIGVGCTIPLEFLVENINLQSE